MSSGGRYIYGFLTIMVASVGFGLVGSAYHGFGVLLSSFALIAGVLGLSFGRN